MTTDNHILSLIDTYLTDGLDDAERRAFDAHVAACGDCAAALDAARAADARFVAALAGAVPGPAFEDRLIGALRPQFSRPSLMMRLSRPIRHPMVRRIAVGVAASLVIGTVGYGMSVAVENQSARVDSAEESGVAQVAGSVAKNQAGEQNVVASGGDRDGLILEADARSVSRRYTLDGKTTETAGLQAPLGTEQTARAKSEADAQVARKTVDSSQMNSDETAVGRSVLTSRTHRTDNLRFFSNHKTPKSEVDGRANSTAYFASNADFGTSSANGKDYYNYRWSEPQSGAVDGPVGAPAGTTTASRSLGRNSSGTTNLGLIVDGTTTGKPQSNLPAIQTFNETAASADSNTLAWGLAVADKEDKKLEPAPTGNGPIALSIPDFTDAPNFNLQTVNGATTSGGVGGGGTGNQYRGGVAVTAGTVQVNKGTAVEGKLGEVRRSGLVSNFDTGQGVADARGWDGFISGENGRWYKPTQLGTARSESELEKLKSSGKDQLKDLSDGQKLSESLAGDRLSVARQHEKSDAVPDGGTLLLGGQTLAADVDSDHISLESNGERAKRLRTVQSVALDTETKPPASSTPEKLPAPVIPKPVKPEPVEVQPRPEVQVRKIIRNGVVTFEVDSFDSALIQVSKLVTEEGGFVSTTSSDKLPNGKVRGSVTVRVPPDRLDTLVLKLRGMGDLKNQRIGAEDVTKRYTDIASQLRAATAMEERLLAIIKNGGEVKDLLEAEKQLGVWREKLELLHGEIKYYDNLVSLATLVIELQEREVRSPTAAFEVETVNTAVETEEVESVRTEILKAIEQAKGRVIDSDLKKLEAGQLSATIKASVAPDAAGPVIDRLKQLGKLARLDISRKTATEGGSGPIVAGLRVEKRETQFEIHIYNLANIEPRQTTSLNLAAQDVEATFKQILDQVKSAGGTIKTSQLNRPKADQTSGTIVFQIPSAKADVLLGAVRAGVDVMRMDVAINPDTQNTTEAKRGFAVQIMSLSQVPARETTTLQVAAADVPSAFRKLLDAATNAGGRVVTSQLNEQDANNITGQLEFETSREKWSTVEGVLREAGAIISRSAVRSSDTESTVDSKIRLSIGLVDEIRLSPRETINATIATRTVQETFDKLLRAAKDSGARVVGSNLNLADRANPNGTLRFATPRENAVEFEQAMKDAGLGTSRATARLPDGPMTVENKVGYIVTVVDERTLQARESHSMVVVAPSAKDRYNKLVDALRIVDALVLSSQLSVQNRSDITGSLVFVINRSDREIIEQVLSENTDVFNRSIERSQDTQGTVDTKIRYSLSVKEAGQQPPRQVFQLTVETTNIDKAIGDLEAAAIAAGGRKIEAERARQDRKDGARVVVDVPLAAIGQLITSVRGQGEVTANQSRQNEAIPEGALSRSRIEITYATPATVASEKGFGESLREGMSGALTGLFKVLQWVIFGLVVIVPCMIVIWIGYQLVRVTRPKSKKVAADTFGPTPNPT